MIKTANECNLSGYQDKYLITVGTFRIPEGSGYSSGSVGLGGGGGEGGEYGGP